MIIIIIVIIIIIIIIIIILNCLNVPLHFSIGTLLKTRIHSYFVFVFVFKKKHSNFFPSHFAIPQENLCTS